MEGLATWLHTPQKVIETRRDHMWSSPHATQASAIPSRAHPCQNRWSALSGPALLECSSWNPPSKTPGESSSRAIHDPTVPTIQTLISSGGSCIAWVFFLEKKHGQQNLQVNLPQKQYTTQQCQPALDNVPCKASVKKQNNKVISCNMCKKDYTGVRPHLTSCETASVVYTMPIQACKCMTFLCLETSLQCREVIDTLCPGISAQNWCLEAVLPLLFPCFASLAC